MICGIDVTLYEVTQDGVDDFNKPILEEIPVTVPNVVVAPASSTDILSTTQIYGKKQCISSLSQRAIRTNGKTELSRLRSATSSLKGGSLDIWTHTSRVWCRSNGISAYG